MTPKTKEKSSKSKIAFYGLTWKQVDTICKGFITVKKLKQLPQSDEVKGKDGLFVNISTILPILEGFDNDSDRNRWLAKMEYRYVY